MGDASDLHEAGIISFCGKIGWRGVANLPLRRCKLIDPAGAHHPHSELP
jgi:hypothetical protein